MGRRLQPKLAVATAVALLALLGNGYRFAKGHKVELQLLGRDAPYYQPGRFPYTVRASDLRITLPTLQRQPR